MIEEQKFYWKLLDSMKDGVYFADSHRKITYWNKAAEAITGYRSAEVLGKFCGDNLLVHIDEEGNNLCTGPCPLARCMKQKEPCEARIFLHHKDGHRVPVLVRVNPVYGSNDQVIGAVEIFSDLSSKEPFLKDIEEREQQDLLHPLTGLPNKEYIDMSLKLKLIEWNEFKHPFGVFCIAAAGLEDVKSKRGRETYEEILKTLSRTLIHNIKPSDMVGQWTEEEFLGIVCQGDEKKLSQKAAGYRHLLEKSELPAGDGPVSLDFSVSFAVVRGGDTVETLIERARS